MTTAPLFGLLILDRDPFVFANLGGLVQAWLQDAGGFAALGLLAYLLYALRVSADQAEATKYRAGVSGFMLVMAVLCLLTYAGCAAVLIFNYKTGQAYGVDAVNIPHANAESGGFVKYVPPKFSPQAIPLLLMAGGAFALLGIGQPFAASLMKVKGRRVFALAKLGFKEAIANRLVWLFLVFLIPLLFPVTWFIPYKPENELRLIVAWSAGVSQVVLLFVAGLVGAFAIPNDVKSQNIYTIVTKPVERFEIVLGRFLGYFGLMSLALFAATTVNWVYISTTKVNDSAREETQKSRVPVRGTLTIESRKGLTEGTNVGREFDYRRYVAGHQSSAQRAVYSFDSVPSGLTAGRDHVPCEFTFDIFRLTKGEENRGVDLTVRIVTWQCPQRPPVDPQDGTWKWADAEQERAYEADAREWVGKIPGVTAQEAQNPAGVLALARPGTPGRPSAAWDVVNRLAEKYGYYEIPGKEIFDYHPASIAVPVGIFQNATKAVPKAEPGKPTPPLVRVYVKCQTGGQMLGVAEGDLYLLEGQRTFSENFFKAAVGLWCRIGLVLGVTVCMSTYLAGVISFLFTLILYVAGYATEHLADLATGRSAAGGPFTAINKLMRAELTTAQADPNSVLTAPLDFLDLSFSWVVRRFINLVPDVYAYGWTDYLKEGFDVPYECLVMNVVVAVGYLLPWFILGFYLMRSREIAE